MGLRSLVRRLLRRRVPAGAGGRRGGRGGPDTGGAGVREPRRPGPTRPATSAAAPEPGPDQFLDLGSPR